MNTLINWKDGVTPEPPYYANIFSYLNSDDLDGYLEMDEITLGLVAEIDGYLGYESSKIENRGLFISYWRDLDAIDQWRKDMVHIKAKSKGKSQWYKYYHSKIVRIESAHYHSFD